MDEEIYAKGTKPMTPNKNIEEQVDKLVEDYLRRIKEGWYQDIGLEDPSERGGLMIHTDVIEDHLKRDIIKMLAKQRQEIIEIVDEQIKIWKSMDEDLPVPRLQDQIVEALNDIKEALTNDTK